MNIIGQGIVLRAVELDDVPALHRWSNDPDIQNALVGWHFPLSRHSLQQWVEGFAHDSRDQRFIIDAAGIGAVGMVTLTGINWKDRNAFHGVLIGEHAQRRRGHALAAVRAIMDYAFQELGLERLDTSILETNRASIDLHVKRCGWMEEGRKLRAAYRKGSFHTLVVLGAMRDVHAPTQ